MVDRHARDKLVLLLRQLAAGRITNDELEDRQPLGSPDSAVAEVFYRGASGFYSDLHEHRLAGRYRLSNGEVRVWPFLRREDFDRAVRNPCYLAAATSARHRSISSSVL